MNKQILREIIVDQKLQLLSNQPQDIINREIYPKIEYYLKSDQMLVISGLRRCGKSTLLQQIRNNSKEKDYYLNFDDERLIQFTVDDFQDLFELFIELYGEQKWFYFDEIQNITGWERFVRRLHDYGNQVVVTGSNASMLSKELGTHLTGRHYQIELYPFSFREFLDYNKTSFSNYESTVTKGKLQGAFKSFMELGGIPGYLRNRQPEYLQSLYENIIYRDIVARYRINKVAEIKELAYYSASNIGKEISFNRLKTALNLGNASTVKDYYEYFGNSFLFFLLPRFDYSLSKQILTNKKVYMVDTAMAKLLGFRFSEDHGRLLENIVFTELKRKNQEIYCHRGAKECDFVIRKQNKITQAIQVCTSLQDRETKEREYAGLCDAMSRYGLNNGCILTYDEDWNEDIVFDGGKYSVDVLPVWKWLLGFHEITQKASDVLFACPQK